MLNIKFIAFSISNTKNHPSSSVPKAKNIWHELQYSSINRRVQKKMQKFLNIFLFNFLSHNNKVFIHLSLTHSFSLLFFSFASSLTHSLIFRFVSSSRLCLSHSKAWVLLSLSLSLSHLSWAVVTMNVKFGLILGFAWSVVWSVWIAVVGLINIGCWLSLAWVNQKQVWYFFSFLYFYFYFILAISGVGLQIWWL